ncbi:MAG: short-chain dehydrogenase [Flavobacteriaceae bacterium]|nr:short-chain dehydrogenase [Flavobacteriaceae bacterium]|tara:strand:+ start:22251 stop:22931 length:681 start_codon:yes stop_codon:yes gene_type:complete
MSKNVIITGTSSGIGFELVKLFSEKKHNVLAISRNNNALRILNLKGVMPIDLDLTESEDYNLLDKYLSSFKNIDILINNAGYLVNKPFEETTLKDFQDVYSTNVFSVAMLTKKIIRFMSESSNVVNISSIGGVQGSMKFSGLSAYSSSKAALNILTEMLAEEYKDRKIHFNSLALGSVETKMLKKAFPDFKASTSAIEMANYIYQFSVDGYMFLNGKIVSVSSTTP